MWNKKLRSANDGDFRAQRPSIIEKARLGFDCDGYTGQVDEQCCARTVVRWFGSRDLRCDPVRSANRSVKKSRSGLFVLVMGLILTSMGMG
jgi:hypothetical protein